MKINDMTRIGLFTALLAVFSWISIPASIPFTLQTMGVFLAVGLLGGRNGTIAVVVYLFLGMIGIPVFSGFRGGIGALLGPTGGYLIGFIFTSLVMWFILSHFGRNNMSLLLSMIAGLIVCYAFGTVWFVEVYSKTNGNVSFISTLSTCVLPFLIPDSFKIILSFVLIKKLYPVLQKK